MAFDVLNPQHGFRNFLEKAEQDGWIAGYRWASSDSLKLLRSQLGGKRKPEVSRTHKRGTDGMWYGLEVESDYGACVGVDLELLVSRPILDRPEWLAQRFEGFAGELRKFVQEQYAVHGHGNLTRARIAATANHGHGRRRMMRSAVRPLFPGCKIKTA